MDDIVLVYSQRQDVFLISVALLSLLVGSFLNVVIHRLPIMLERQWQREFAQMNEPAVIEKAEQRFDLILPGSHCPHCQNPIKPWHNIPVFSYVWLKGRCPNCSQSISLRYPLIELGCMLISLTVAWHFGFSWQTAAALLLSWSLLALTMIDFDKQLLPDMLTLPVLWLGLLVNLSQQFTDIHSAIWGAVVGYLVLWSIYQAYRLLTGREGMGYGDFKLAAMLGAWLGWQMLPLVLLLSSFVGAVVGISLMLLQKSGRHTAIPFGPYLAVAGWIALLWGAELMTWYLDWMM